MAQSTKILVLLSLACFTLLAAAQDACPSTPLADRAACICKTAGTAYKYYADTAKGCTGAAWCYGPGQSTYVTCQTVLLFSDKLQVSHQGCSHRVLLLAVTSYYRLHLAQGCFGCGSRNLLSCCSADLTLLLLLLSHQTPTALQTCDWAANVICTAPPASSPTPSPSPPTPPKASPSPSPTPSIASPSPQPPAGSSTCSTGSYTQPGGACGSSNGLCCPSGCCSKYGYCGISDAHCGSGCQAGYGSCSGSGGNPGSPSPVPASPPPVPASPSPVPAKSPSPSPAPVTPSPSPAAPPSSSPQPPSARATLPVGPLVVGYYQVSNSASSCHIVDSLWHCEL
jgi:hypothetical protein